jgi:DNA-binding SARP family transcriptional activator
MSYASFTLFGKLQMQLNGHDIIGCEARKLQELLCYLLLYRDRPQCREMLAAVFWGNAPTAQSKKYLRQTLWQLQTALNSQGTNDHESLLVVDSISVRLNPQTSYWLDVALFEAAFAQVQRISAQALTLEHVQSLQAATQLYKGDLLEGWHDDWCIFERERLQSMYLAMLDKLISHSEIQQDFASGLLYGVQVLRYDQARESTHRRLMRLYYLTGDRTGALRQYQACVAALRQELDVEPADSTRRLYQQICADKFSELEGSQHSHQQHTPAAPAPSLVATIDQLKVLQSTLTLLNQHVTECIHTVEHILQRHQ